MDVTKVPTDRKVRELMRLTGWKQMDVAEHFDVSQSTINRWLSGAEPRGRKRDALNALYVEKTTEGAIDEQSADDESIDTVPLVGYVGAGAAAHFYGSSQGELERVKAPEFASRDTVAVEIRGESLGPLFEHWLVYYDEVRSPVTPDMYGRLCVVGLIDEKVLVKQIRPSKTPGYFHLLSNTEAPIMDAEVVWAARVRTMVPR